MNNIIGLDDFYIWRESDKEHLPDVSFIPPMMRRRMTDLQKIAIGVAHHVAPENTDYQMVFASRYGEWQQTLKLIKQFHDDGEMSPAGFSNSVHNAAAGVFSVLAFTFTVIGLLLERTVFSPSVLMTCLVAV